jgi:hypothetical protein
MFIEALLIGFAACALAEIAKWFLARSSMRAYLIPLVALYQATAMLNVLTRLTPDWIIYASSLVSGHVPSDQQLHLLAQPWLGLACCLTLSVMALLARDARRTKDPALGTERG